MCREMSCCHVSILFFVVCPDSVNHNQGARRDELSRARAWCPKRGNRSNFFQHVAENGFSAGRAQNNLETREVKGNRNEVIRQRRDTSRLAFAAIFSENPD